MTVEYLPELIYYYCVKLIKLKFYEPTQSKSNELGLLKKRLSKLRLDGQMMGKRYLKSEKKSERERMRQIKREIVREKEKERDRQRMNV